MIFEGEAGRGASGGEAELIDDFFPEFVVGDRLASSFFADGLIKLIEVELLPAYLWNFDLRDALARPVLAQVLLEFVLLF